jgi:hypothetical protein
MTQISPSVTSTNQPHNQLVGLNIGGTKFLTTRETLLKGGENFFTSLLAGRIPTAKDKHGNYFIDRNGKYAIDYSFLPSFRFLFYCNVFDSYLCVLTREIVCTDPRLVAHG